MADSTSTPIAPAHGAPLKGVLLIALGGVLFSIAPIFARAVEGYSATSIVFFRALIMSLVLGTLTAVHPVRRADANPLHMPRRVFLWVILLGISMGLTAVTYTYAYRHTTLAKAVLLNYTAPIYVALFGPWLLREKGSPSAKIAVPLGVLGIALIAEPSKLASISQGEVLGILAGAASGVAFAAVFMIGRYLADKTEPMARTLIAGMVMTLMFLPWGLNVPGGWELFRANLPWLLCFGVIGFTMPYFAIFSGQKLVSAQVGSMIALVEPACGVIVGYVGYGETLTVWGLIGAAAVLVSIYLSSK